MGSEPRRYICERCGGSGQQVEGLWNKATEKYDAPAGVCDGCKGSGYLGVIEQPDLDALAAIDAKRTPGEWEIRHSGTEAIAVVVRSAELEAKYPADKFGEAFRYHQIVSAWAASEENLAAIVTAVNAIGPLIERCKRAEASLLLPEGEMIDFYKMRMVDHRDAAIENRKQVAFLTRQRDELLAACEACVEQLSPSRICSVVIPPGEVPYSIMLAKTAIDRVKGGADGTAG